MHSLPIAATSREHAEHDAKRASTWLRTDPYRLLFPLGVLLAWAGVGQWLMFAVGATAQFRIVFHAMVQIQSFLGCFVAGFLLTFIPRRTMSGPPAAWQTLWAAANPVLLAVFAWQERWAVAQVFWLLQLGLLAQFAVSRVRAAANQRPVLPSLTWIPAALLMGLGGALLTPFSGWHDVGRALVLEGFVTALVIGIGAMLVPVITRSEGPQAPDKPLRWYAIHVAAEVTFVASFWTPVASALEGRAGYLLRLAIVSGVLVWGARLWRRPTEPGLNRWAVWLAAWCVPLGYALLSVWPLQRALGLHVLFIGGFGLLALSIGHHVLMAHGGKGRWLQGSSWGTRGLLLCIGVSLVARAAMQLDPAHYLGWMATASSFFMLAGALWLVEALRPKPAR